MNDLPHEMLGEILSRAGPLHYASRVNRLFHSLCKVEPCKNIDEVKKAIKMNDILRIKASEDLVEENINCLIVKACKYRNKGLAKYLVDFGGCDPHLCVFDDISMIKDDLACQGIEWSAKYKSIKLFTHFYSRIVGREIIDIRQDLLTHKHDTFYDYLIAWMFIDDTDILRRCKRESVMKKACEQKNLNAVKLAMEMGEDPRRFALDAAYSNFVEFFKIYQPRHVQRYMNAACFNNSVDVIDWLLSKGAVFKYNNLTIAIKNAHYQLVKRILEVGEPEEEDFYIACDKGKGSIVKLLIDKVMFNIAEAIKSCTNYKLAYELFPCDETRLYLACEEEDLDTVKELYPCFPHSLFSTFSTSSYELLCILYRKEDISLSVYSFGINKFRVEMGHITAQDCVERIKNNLRVVKYLQEKGAKIEDNEKYSPRVRRYLASTASLPF